MNKLVNEHARARRRRQREHMQDLVARARERIQELEKEQ
jgi:hypothetical protein